MFDIISIGDATIDTFLELHKENISLKCNIQKEQCLICFNYADKIPVNNMTRQVAGNAANNAVGSSRLGLKTAICTIVGDDDNGEWILNKLKKEKVSIKYSYKAKKRVTNASTVINYDGERTILVYHAERPYKLPIMDGTKWVYYTSVGKNHANYNKQVISFVQKRNYKLAFNPGTYQLITGLEGLKPVFAACTALFVNKEEAARIVGIKDDIRTYLLSLHSHGPKIVVITDGQNGSFAYDGKEFYQMGLIPGTVVERTGAGDAFSTAFIAALHYKKTIQEAMCWGATNSASVIEHIGPQLGLLSMDQLIKKHKSKKHICAKPL